MSVPIRARPTTEGAHIVDFYSDRRELVIRVGEHLAHALDAGGAVVAVCTPAVRAGLLAGWEASGRDMDGAKRNERLVVLDAAATMDRVMIDGRPDPARFDAVIGDLMRSLSAPGRPVHAFGEIVALLWEDGRVNEAMELEALWNDLGATLPFTLYCAYPTAIVGDDYERGEVRRVCELHSCIVGQPGPEPGRVVSSLSVRNFPPEPRSAALARWFATDALAEHPALDDVIVAVSELATNAIVHGASDFTVTIARSPGGLRLSVRDSGFGQPVLRSPGISETAGRGLHLVAILADRWGVDPADQGKVVWAEFELDERLTARVVNEAAPSPSATLSCARRPATRSAGGTQAV